MESITRSEREPFLYDGFAFYEVFAESEHKRSLGYVVAVKLNKALMVSALLAENLGKTVVLREEDFLYRAVMPVSERRRAEFRECWVAGRFLDGLTELVGARRVYEIHREMLQYLDFAYNHQE